MLALKKRLAEVERTRGVDRSRLLPEIVRVPDDEPARSRVLASIERKRSQGQRVIDIRMTDDEFDAMVQAIDEFV